jgi:Lipocalin-like domain
MATDNNGILGVWQLESWEIQKKDGTFKSRGKNVHGLLMYSSTGHMSVSLTSDGPDIFYAGTYELKDNRMLHRAEMSFDPKHFTNVRRRVTLNGDSLILLSDDDAKRGLRLTWKRIGGPPA